MGFPARYFWRRIIFELVKQIVLPHVVGLTQSVEDQNGTKLLSLPSEREFLLIDCLQPGTSVFPAFRPEVKHWLLLGLETAGLWTGAISSVLLVLTAKLGYVLRKMSVCKGKKGVETREGSTGRGKEDTSLISPSPAVFTTNYTHPALGVSVTFN